MEFNSIFHTFSSTLRITSIQSGLWLESSADEHELTYDEEPGFPAGYYQFKDEVQPSQGEHEEG